jgi:hypothetical protein
MALVVFAPYTFVHAPTWAALSELELAGHYVHHADVSDSDSSYLIAMRNLWRLRATFAVCEHDVIPTVGQVDQLDTCPQPWCSFNEYDGGPPTLSLARFRRSFIDTWPALWDDLLVAHRVRVFQPLWTKLDSWLTDVCGQPCLHETPHVINARPHGVTHFQE